MPISLYELSVPTYLQTLGAANHFLERALTHFREHGVDPNEVVETRIFPDMLPFRFQVQSIVHHSVHAIDALKSGTFVMTRPNATDDYAALQAQVQDASATLQKLTPDEIDAREGGEVTFHVNNFDLRFSAADFVLSFSLPNFHFHAATAYDILRAKGVPLGKRHFLGKLRLKR